VLSQAGSGSVGEPGLEHADIVIAALGTLVVASIADMLTGRRGYFATLLVASTGSLCGWFLSIRVFSVTTMGEWTWIAWALVGSGLSLLAYNLFRNMR
jgi:uncharacterized membrane protein YeaQ/YmgE (transglycosylase-associated protein family)